MRKTDTDHQKEDPLIVTPVKKDIPTPEITEGEEIIIKCGLEEIIKDFFKDYVIVWQDPNVNSEENQQYIVQLKKFCEVFAFTEWQKARDFIQTANATCHVITSGTNGELLVKEILSSQSVLYIYVFCAHKDHHSSWTQNNPKISSVETDIEKILFQIQQNLMEWYKQASSRKLNLPAFAPIFDDSDKSQMNNLHRFLKIIPNFQNRTQAKNDFLNLSKEMYFDKKNTKLIADFEQNYNEYDKEQTLRWYTQESFMYKVTNNCLRIATSDSIQYCRLVLKDIEQAIKEQYQTQSKDFNGLLYRGSYLSEDEWSSLKTNVNQEIEMHGFLSVSKEKKVALKFMRMDPSQKVFVTIIVPKGENEEEQGFAEVEDFSRFPKEKEILFNVRSRFTILETEDEYSPDLPCRHLVLLYGAQGFRKFTTEWRPAQEISIPEFEKMPCSHCKVVPKKTSFISLTDPQKQIYFCKECIDDNFAPFLRVTPTNKSSIVKINGCLLMNSQKVETPLYGYHCNQCEAKKQKQYFVCLDCNKKWCQNCFEKDTINCVESQHNIILETHPFSFWSERASQIELDCLEHSDHDLKKKKLFQQAHMFYDSQLYSKATEYYRTYIQQNETKGKDPDLANCYYNLGRVYSNQQEPKKALEYYSKSLDIFIALYGDNHQGPAVTYHSIGRIQYGQGEYNKALEYYSKSLEIRKALFGDNHYDTAICYNDIGLIHNNLGEYDKALEYHLKALEIRKYAYGDHHPDIADSYNNIGRVHSGQGEYEKALGYYLKALDLLKANYGDNHSDTVTSYYKIGSIYEKQREYKKALEYYLKSLDILKFMYGDNHPNLGILFGNIGIVFLNQGEYKKALEFSLKSLEIGKAVYGDNHPRIATSLSNIAYIYDSLGKYKRALEYYLQCIEIKKLASGDSNPDLASYYNNIGWVHNNLGEYKKALEYHSKSLEIRKSVYGDHHPDIAASYNQIGLVHRNQGEYKKALEYYLKSLEIRKSASEEKDLKIGTLYNNIGLVYKNLREYDKSLEYHLKSLDIFRSVYEDSHPDLATSYDNIGLVSKHQEDHSKALEYHSKSLERRESVYKDDHPAIATSYSNLGSVYEKQGKYAKALEYYLKSLDIRKEFFEDNHRSLAASYKNLGSVYQNLGDLKMALEYYLKSLSMRKSVYGDDRHKTLSLQKRILEIQSILQQN